MQPPCSNIQESYFCRNSKLFISFTQHEFCLQQLIIDSISQQGKKPEALYKVQDPEVRQFVEKCLAAVSHRLPARELLEDPFLQIDDYGSIFRPIDYEGDLDDLGPVLRQPHYGSHNGVHSWINGYGNYLCYARENELEYHSVEFETNELDLFTCQEDEHLADVEIAIKGRRREDDDIFLRLRIADKEG